MKFIKKTPRCAVLMVVLASYVHSEFNNDHFTVYQGFEISAGTSRLFSREVASKLSCARLCAQETSCCTISFNTGSMMCVLVEDCSPLLQITNMGLAMTKIEGTLLSFKISIRKINRIGSWQKQAHHAPFYLFFLDMLKGYFRKGNAIYLPVKILLNTVSLYFYLHVYTVKLLYIDVQIWRISKILLYQNSNVAERS